MPIAFASASHFFSSTFLSSRHLLSSLCTSNAVGRDSVLLKSRQLLWPTCPSRPNIQAMAVEGESVPLSVLPLNPVGISIRPRNVRTFSIPYDDLVIRAWKQADRVPCITLIGSVLAEYGLDWDPLTADRDVVDVETAYKEGEFWVVEDITTACVVGTAAFYHIPHRGSASVEIRKMYLSKQVRGRGLGSFLLSAIEQRAIQLGYTNAVIETASVLQDACILYRSRGYLPSEGVETARCDIVLAKPLAPFQQIPDGDYVEAIDMTKGWAVDCIPRKQSLHHRILYRAVVVLVQSGDKVFVHQRSMKKLSYPGSMSALVTGCVDWMEEPLSAAKREVWEEIGISDLKFSEPFPPFVSKRAQGQRIQFHPYIAKGNFSEEEVVLNPEEVEQGQLMLRQEIMERGIGGDLFKEFRERGL